MAIIHSNWMMMVRNDMIKFDLKYFALTISLFIIETLIALYVHDNFVRPYFGDVLVVILIYCFVKSFFKLKVLTAALFVLLFSFAIEFLQYLNIVEKLELQHSKIARTVIGTSFSWEDIISYVAGILIVISIEYFISKKT
ncbi:ribosomal maturation YjgA family protein [Flavobacterium sangjuense]|uniref:DUF2809 domain-containing protein n=1 Tax=Flavobacterium sangjuense TaxID=2518177 RepID=A0A4P7PU79_9FLAO|nr:DUF2809 domain-containing protein [Flavobacterium sangjuense]QBZ98276.1 hypothetical protein GS03_01781 [Flavobacterium sangjuense]